MRIMVTCALGLALVASEAVAQDTTRSKPARSDRRIVISKGEVATMAPRVDTVYVTRFDTVFVSKRDTLTMTNTVLRVDTVTVPAPVPLPIPKGEVYWGAYGGTTMPSGNIDRLYSNGYHVGALLGWEGQDRLLGLRFTGDVSQIGREQGFASSFLGTKTPLLFTFGTDLKVIPLNFTDWRLYGIGGVNYHVYRGVATASEAGTGLCNVDGKGGCYQPATESSWKGKFGFNVGAGTDFHVASQEMFLEARVTALQANGARTWLLPISFGLRFF